MQGKKKKKKPSLLPKIILVVFVIYASSVLISNQLKINRIEAETSKLDSLIVDSEMKKMQLQEVLDAEIDDEYMTKEAQRQGYVAPNEIVFRDISGS